MILKVMAIDFMNNFRLNSNVIVGQGEYKLKVYNHL